jgi:predicted nuclease of predicted toxin-antitoxin system
MKLLLDQNLSFRLCRQLADLFPGSGAVNSVGLAKADDRVVWNYAKAHGFVLVSQDADFAEMAALLGPPPKVIWLRRGNQSSAVVEAMLRDHFEAITAFEGDVEAACLEVY